MRRWILSALSFQTTDSDSERKARTANEEGGTRSREGRGRIWNRRSAISSSIARQTRKLRESNQAGLEWRSARMHLFQTWTPSSPHSAQTPIARMQARPNHIQPLHLGARRVSQGGQGVDASGGAIGHHRAEEDWCCPSPRPALDPVSVCPLRHCRFRCERGRGRGKRVAIAGQGRVVWGCRAKKGQESMRI
jgi:hypothetical protein